MSTDHLIPEDIRALYEVKEWRNAVGVLTTAYPKEWDDILKALRDFRLLRSEILKKGGRKSLVAIRFDSLLYGQDWKEREFDTKIQIDDNEFSSPTHKVDCFKNGVALEVEWNNKTEFYDRDLNNFRLLYDLRVIGAGIIVTRSSHLQNTFKALGRGNSYGASTTHFDKLIPRLEGGSGGGCPVLAFGITKELYVEDEIPADVPPAEDPNDANELDDGDAG